MLARCRGLDPERAELVLPGGDLPSLAFWVAAARELLEETGVCLARDRLGLPIETTRADVGEAVERCRLGLAGRRTTFAALLAREGWHCDLGSLHYFSHFTTPVASPVRFSARFFLCPLPAGQTPRLTSTEATDGFWIGAAAGLHRYRAGRLPMAEPPEYALAYLAQFDSLDEVWAAHADGQHKVHGILDRTDAFYSEGFDRTGRPHRSRGSTA
jgi:8-oxo-dGTP pyrophosphatase MutT (NUDIX family)